ncbi:MAG: DUF177 domain-containing protein [Verrucomicrobia bacterium]|nr:DUF177 domain-containing protein [Verrucomicrobiota bacterium]
MPLLVNLHHLSKKNLQLAGELTEAELGLAGADELIHWPEPLQYELEVQSLDNAVLAQGTLWVNLRCDCARCLKAFDFPLELSGWAAHLPLEGEDAVPIQDDCVDLTPLIREDILLKLPQHPLCETECPGLPAMQAEEGATRGASQSLDISAAWAELNKLKPKN